MIVTLINPNLVVQCNDMFTTGVVYMPIGLAYFASIIRQNGFECNVIDAFGEKPNQCKIEDNLLIRGLTRLEVAHRIDANSKAIVLYASNITYHRSLVQIILTVHSLFPSIPIIVMENTQAVTAYSLRRIQEEYYDSGVDYIITGESEERGVELLKKIQNNMPENNLTRIDGIGFQQNGVVYYNPPVRKIVNLDTLPFPAWDLFPLENYWDLKYSHGPFETKKYLPLLTSRGCPYSCRFCVIPETNYTDWRSRSAKNVVDEIEHHLQRFGVKEFHIEDANPTVNDKRIREICEEIISRGIKIIWKIAAGTKVETIREESTIELMAKSGCRYISISPESGSPRVLKMINKTFNLEHAVQLVKKMTEVGIRSQACFVLGYPGENDEDREMTMKLVRDLTMVGVDEIALFIISPIPGSSIYEQFSGYTDYSQLNFSPAWREDYERLNKFRLQLYRKFLLWKLKYHPLKIAKQPINFLMRRFETKMEMTPYRALHTALMKWGIIGKLVYEN